MYISVVHIITWKTKNLRQIMTGDCPCLQHHSNYGDLADVLLLGLPHYWGLLGNTHRYIHDKSCCYLETSKKPSLRK